MAPPIFRLVAPQPRKGGFIRLQWDNGVQIFHDKLTIITGPEKRDRLVQFLYTQLPYHPQRIEKNTAWTVEISEPLSLPPQTATLAGATPPGLTPSRSAQDDPLKTWIIQAYLGDQLNSATSKSGQEIKATIAEPIYNPDHSIAVPQGATMIGAVTQAKPSRRFGRAGALHFDFRQLTSPTAHKTSRHRSPGPTPLPARTSPSTPKARSNPSRRTSSSSPSSYLPSPPALSTVTATTATALAKMPVRPTASG